jgi:hypothetical protein
VKIFEEIQGVFQGSLVGFGEVGTHCTRCDGTYYRPRSGKECVKLQRANVQKHYGELHRKISDLIKKDGHQIDYAGGYFYWFFSTDMVKTQRTDPDRKPALEELLAALDGWV